VKVYSSIESFVKLKNAVVTPGTFDGVHWGHQRIIERLKEIAARTGGETVVLTFHPHPRMVLYGEDSNLRLLTTLDEKTELLRKAGIDHFIIHPFTKEFAKTNIVEYVRDLLIGKIGMKKLVIGYDHHFGRHREGNLERLLELAPVFNFEIEEIPAQEISEVNVSSTKIRAALDEGDVKLANEFLGYRYALSGIVIPGRQVGRTLGFPTANVDIDNPYKLIPAEGVYAVKVRTDQGEFNGMLNIGHRPTFNNNIELKTLEVHLLNFDGDLYGRNITIELVERIRSEVKFENSNDLKSQLESDKQNTEHIFQKA
jgi:riboflavin kinase / FMN adenylyltransferase